MINTRYTATRCQAIGNTASWHILTRAGGEIKKWAVDTSPSIISEGEKEWRLGTPFKLALGAGRKNADLAASGLSPPTEDVLDGKEHIMPSKTARGAARRKRHN